MKNPHGFTLMEILVVVLIIGVLASVAIPSYSTHIERVRSSEGVQSLTALLASQKRFQLENSGAYSTTLAALDIDIAGGAANSNFNVPTVANNAAAVASIVRNSGTIPYTLSINDTGVVSCACAACNPANICGQIGY